MLLPNNQLLTWNWSSLVLCWKDPVFAQQAQDVGLFWNCCIASCLLSKGAHIGCQAILQPSSCKVKEQEVVLRAVGQLSVMIFSQPLLVQQNRAWDSIEMRLLYQQGYWADQFSCYWSTAWSSVVLYWAEKIHRAFLSEWLDGITGFPWTGMVPRNTEANHQEGEEWQDGWWCHTDQHFACTRWCCLTDPSADKVKAEFWYIRLGKVQSCLGSWMSWIDRSNLFLKFLSLAHDLTWATLENAM